MIETLEIAAQDAALGELLSARMRHEEWHADATPDFETSPEFYQNTENYAAVEASLGNLTRAQELWSLIPVSHRTAAVQRNIQGIQGGNGLHAKGKVGHSELRFSVSSLTGHRQGARLFIRKN